MNVLIVIPTSESRKDKFQRLSESLANMKSDGKFRVTTTNGDQGFTIAVNDGLHTISHEDFVWLLNDDTAVFPDTLNKSIEFMDNYPNCGIMGHRNLSMEEPDKIIWGGSGTPFPAGQHKIGNVKLGDLREQTKEKWVTFSSAFIRTSVVRMVGMLDPNMIWVYSDSDFCYRARAFGWECWYNPEASILHEHGVSKSPFSDELKARFLLDQLYFASKWINGKVFYDLNTEILDEEKKDAKRIHELRGEGRASQIKEPL